jgi:hypothetical protein
MSSFDRDKALLSKRSKALATPKLRVGWNLFFAEMATEHDNTLLDDVIATDWDEWEWSLIIIPGEK